MSEKPSAVRFSADDGEILINFVQNNAILYDLKYPYFKNTLKKDLPWGEIGKLIQKEGNHNNFITKVFVHFLNLVLQHFWTEVLFSDVKQSSAPVSREFSREWG